MLLKTSAILDAALFLFFYKLSSRYPNAHLQIPYILTINLYRLIFFSLREISQCQIVLEHCSLFHKQQKAIIWQKQLFLWAEKGKRQAEQTVGGKLF